MAKRFNQTFFLKTVEQTLQKGDLAYGETIIVKEPTRFQGYGLEFFILPLETNAREFFTKMFRDRGISDEETIEMIFLGAGI